jgi:predicted Zn-dependent protease with MMP-like domain
LFLTQPVKIEEHGDIVTREHFIQLAEEVLESLPKEFRERIHNLAIFVEDRPPRPKRSRRAGGSAKPGRLLLGIYQGRPATQRSVFDLPTGPDRIVLYQKNIEAICSSEAEIRHEIRQTVLHELGHYFGMDEAQLKDV